MTELNQVCYATLKYDEPWTIENYFKVGGWDAWKKILQDKIPPEELLEEVKQSGLRGRFPDRFEMEFHDLCAVTEIRGLQFGRE